MCENKNKYKSFYYQASSKVVIALRIGHKPPVGSVCITGFFPLYKEDIKMFKMVNPNVDHKIILRISKVWEKCHLSYPFPFQIITQYSVK